MTNKIVNVTEQRKKHNPQFKEQALERAKRDGFPKAVKDLGIPEGMIYSWRKKHEQTGIPFENQKLQSAEVASQSER